MRFGPRCRFIGRQVLRRRRGDVHGDLTAAVIRFDWNGERSQAQPHMLP